MSNEITYRDDEVKGETGGDCCITISLNPCDVVNVVISINPDAIRNIVKGHLVSHHGEILNSTLTDDISCLIVESIDAFFHNRK